MDTMFDFNNAEISTGGGELIPANTVAVLMLKLRPGGQGPAGWLKSNSTGTCLMADCEFTVMTGPYARRKFWGNFIVQADTDATDGQKTAEGISRSTFRAILESARGILPAADDAAAMAARKVGGYADFDGIVFCGKIGIETGNVKDPTLGPQSERYDDKNKLVAAITPDSRLYISPSAPEASGVMGGSQAVQAAVTATHGGNASGGAAPAVVKPGWAN